MLRLRQIAITDFGPFKGEQVVDFPTEDGVVILYGENMRGKTTLLNALRYAFFGKVITRGAREIALHQIGNWESSKDGRFGFKVVLKFRHADHEYELTRSCRPRPEANVPESDLDYIQEYFLQCDGSVLGPEQAKVELNRILPEQVSRFFLFDGELLQQYEELLRDESDMGRQIKEAIERILGIPVLTNGRLDLRELQKLAEQQESRAAQKDQKTQELGNHHATLLEQRIHHEQQIKRFEGIVQVLREQKNSKEDALRKTSQVKILLEERDGLQAEIDDINERIQTKEERCRDLLADAWRWLLSPRIQTLRATNQAQIDALRAEDTRRSMAIELLRETEAALAQGQCHVCQQPLISTAMTSLTNLAASLRNTAGGPDATGILNAAIARMAVLDHVDVPDKRDMLRELSMDIEQSRMSRSVKEDRITELRDQTGTFDESELRRLYSEYEKLTREITIVEQGIANERKALTDVDTSIRRIQTELDRVAGSDLTLERRRRELYGKLCDLFNEGIAAFRDRLRTKVEQDATVLFRQLTTEPDYERLQINTRYGLTIVHKDGQSIAVRSAGAEHIVALSLMGALQRNAPLQGPIIMDSPFGRLDHGHTTRVIQSLPNMASQVLLLVYESELEPKLARSGLRGALRGEYRIVRRSARHSDLEKCVGD